MKFVLEIELTEDFKSPEDIADALRKTASHVQSGHGAGQIRDLCGDPAGTYRIEDSSG